MMKRYIQALIRLASRRRILQRLIVTATVILSDVHLIRPASAQTVIRLADIGTRKLSVKRRLRFGPGAATLVLDLPARYPAGLRLMFEDAYTHPTEGLSLHVFVALARSARCICDVGAHVGLYTYAAAAVSNRRLARIYAFEPLPDLCQTIERNVTLHRLANVQPFAVAVGDAAAQAELCVPADTHYTSLHPEWLAEAHIDRFTVVPVQVIALDGFFDVHGPALPDLVKIDVEGHERQALEGMRRILAASRPDIIIELIGLERSREITALLTTEYGYRVFFISDTLHELAPGQPPPEGELHNFLVTRRPVTELRSLLGIPVVEAAVPA